MPLAVNEIRKPRWVPPPSSTGIAGEGGETTGTPSESSVVRCPPSGTGPIADAPTMFTGLSTTISAGSVKVWPAATQIVSPALGGGHRLADLREVGAGSGHRPDRPVTGEGRVEAGQRRDEGVVGAAERSSRSSAAKACAR